MNNKTYKIVIATFLMVVTLLPSVIKVTHHHVSQKNYKNYNQESTHAQHDSTDLCDICFFSISSFNHLFYKAENFTTFFSKKKSTNKEYTFKISTFTFATKQLRAPPIFFS